ncbi:MAG: hypothetical protein H7336_07945, partial [Bacteriovorax sp.]|nr:hypothetical protein [Bacteriovorax sp.]
MKHFILLLFFISGANIFAQSSLVNFKKPQPTFSSYTYINDLVPAHEYMSIIPTPKYIEELKAESDCDAGKQEFGGPTFKKNISNLNAPITALECQEADKIKVSKKLDPQICSQLANCFKNKTKYIVGTPLTVFHNARTKTAAEAISLISQVAIGQMIELE